MVNYWNVPFSSSEGSQTSLPGPTLTLSNLDASSQADLTSIDWSSDGSLVVIGHYNAVLQICMSSGMRYLTDNYYTVGHELCSLSGPY